MTIPPPSVSSEQTADIPCQWMVSDVRVTIINGDVNSQQRWQKPGHGDTDTLVRPNLSRRIPNQTHKAVTFYSWRDLSEVLPFPRASLLSPVPDVNIPGVPGAGAQPRPLRHPGHCGPRQCGQNCDNIQILQWHLQWGKYCVHTGMRNSPLSWMSVM